jgi:hypothetical protein
MRIDWSGVLIALLVTFLAFFILIKTTQMLGFCLDHDITATTHCSAKAMDVMKLDPLSISIAIVRPFLIPIFSFALGIIYYFKGHPIEKWTDVILPSFVIGSLSGFFTFAILIFFQSPILFDFLYLFAVLSWIGFFIGIAVICAVIGGLIVHSLSRRAD